MLSFQTYHIPFHSMDVVWWQEKSPAKKGVPSPIVRKTEHMSPVKSMSPWRRNEDSLCPELRLSQTTQRPCMLSEVY